VTVELSTAHARPWRPTAAHVRAAFPSLVAIGVAVLFRVPDLLVLAAPLAIVAAWSTVRRPGGSPVLRGRLAPATIREGEATTWSGAVSSVDGMEELVALVPRRRWTTMQPTSGVAVSSLGAAGGRTDDEVVLRVEVRSTHWGRRSVGPVVAAASSSWGAFRWVATDLEHRLTTLPRPPEIETPPMTAAAMARSS